ncbi:MAG: tetratricopeptide (TPR) repeat protein [Candidatus Azotimanducaceae bacterium]|jgi:tetratricopeptide (TPR) repeat protein
MTGGEAMMSFLRTVIVALLSIMAMTEVYATNTIVEAVSAFEKGQYELAKSGFRELHRANPNDPQLSFYLARSLYRHQELEAAEKILLKSLEQFPTHVESQYLLGSVHLSRVAEVSIFRKAGLASSAVTAWEQVVTLDPTHAEALYGVASFYLTAPGIAGGDKKLGMQRLAELEALSPPWALLTEASLALRDEQYERAEQLFKNAIKGIPGRAFPSLMLTNLYVKQERFDLALTQLEAYKSRTKTWNDPGLAQTELMAGKIYEGLDRTQAAIKSYEIVLSVVAHRQIKKQAKDALKELYSR